MTSQEELIDTLIAHNIFQHLHKPITLKSGKSSNFYADFRKLYTNPKLLDKVATAILPLIPSSTDYLAGSPLAAIPLTTIISNKLQIPFLLVRPHAKTHGTKRLVEGTLTSPTANITIIEDVITSGQSSYETYQKLKTTFPDANINHLITVFDRQERKPKSQSSVKAYNTLELPYEIRSLLTKSQVKPKLYISSPTSPLSSKTLISYYSATKPPTPPTTTPTTTPTTPHTTTISHTQKLLNSLAKKQSNLIFSADITDPTKLLTTLKKVAPHIVAVKLHTDTMKTTLSPEFFTSLKQISEANDLLIIEDRKFTDIGSTLKLQLTSSLKIHQWADVVTVFPCVTSTGLKIITDLGLSALVIEHLSTYKTYDDNPYISPRTKLATAAYKSFDSHSLLRTAHTTEHSVLGTIGQQKSHKWQFTPGISLSTTSDDLNQKYSTPQQAAKRGADFFIVGRAIHQAPDPVKAAKLYKNECWKAKLENLHNNTNL